MTLRQYVDAVRQMEADGVLSQPALMRALARGQRADRRGASMPELPKPSPKWTVDAAAQQEQIAPAHPPHERVGERAPDANSGDSAEQSTDKQQAKDREAALFDRALAEGRMTQDQYRAAMARLDRMFGADPEIDPLA